MKANLKIIIVVIGMFALCHSIVASAVEAAPHITDREVIDALAELRTTLKAMDQKIELKFQASDQKMELKFQAADQKMELKIQALDQKMELKFQVMDQQFKAVNQQISSLGNMQLTLFMAVISLIVALFGYIAWDRSTMIKPLQERIERVERMQLEFNRDLEI